jgi:hypothetical protein
MQKSSKIILAGGIINVLIVAGVAFGLLGTRHTGPHIEPAAAVEPVAAPSPVSATTVIASASSPDAAVVNTPSNWEERVDEVVGSDEDITNKVARLFELFPTLPEGGKVEVAQHLSNLVSDQDYAPLGQLLEDARSPEPVLDVLMADALNRPNALKLPLLLAVAQKTDHAKAGQAKDILELYLDGDYGADWTTWRQKVQQWLEDNPD